MNRYIIKFSKGGYLKYISHLDLMRLFDRTLKRSGIQLTYSKGFNPHPKMSIAQPLSLGFSSIGEYLEIETTMLLEPETIKELLNKNLPEGISILRCGKAPMTSKTLASSVEYGRYEAVVPLDGSGIVPQIESYLNQRSIVMTRHQKKTGKDIAVDIRPLIREFACTVTDDRLIMDMVIATGSASNLNPELLVSSFLNYHDLAPDKFRHAITRIDLYYTKDGILLSLDSFIL